MTDWWSGFTAGVVATIIGFVLTTVWDQWKYKRDVKQREEALSTAVKEELKANLKILQGNQSRLQASLEGIEAEKELVAPVSFLKNGSWEVVKITPPRKWIQGNILTQISEITISIDLINEMIRSRENYRIANQALTGLLQRLKKYDEMLLTQCQILREALEKLQLLL
jgi:hypothetical protein